MALRVVSEGGLQAVTHRAVERAAGVPHGTVTYYFGTRDELVMAMVDRLVEDCRREVSGIARDVTMALAPRAGTLDVDGFVERIVAWIDGSRELHLARFEFELAAARDARLRVRMSEAALVFWRLCEPLVQALGSPNPALDGRAMAAAIDGLLLDRISHDPADAGVIESVCRQMILPWSRR